ncbi:uncharacterized protein MELLADRAFT_108614 [Melampsora larici-populina 98AG31]|uniref:Uncharacterized protein n=1 Tax=Melampsora larici-populina (strain 98AG31 / pathotype 3-4-7) TaxID=747676 RepID=F4RTP2_MELLP|nr:uncharacterized protein MELLADRAFT_108614 [Melampsora larici-populina 98AG31]EGG04304.1 hypothetical protein MELLADRAFT_108614 [Melampsora larici-populina 98AG31]
MFSNVLSCPLIHGTSGLPVEVVGLIIAYYMEDTDFLEPSLMNSANRRLLCSAPLCHLLSLRLLSKSWNDAIIPFVYKDLYLATPAMCMGILLSFNGSHRFAIFSGLRKICLSGVVFVSECVKHGSSLGGSNGNQDGRCIPGNVTNHSAIGMDLAAELIGVCGGSLEELDFIFFHSVGFSPDLRVAIGGMEKLNALGIVGGMFRNTWNNSDSLVSLLNSTASLESLSIRCPELYDDELVQAFRYYGIKCMFTYHLTYKEVIDPLCCGRYVF